MEQFRVGKARPDEATLDQPRNAGIIPKVNFRWILSGPSKSGKSNLARWCLDKYYIGKNGRGSFFDRIYLLSPTANIDYNWADLKGLAKKDRITNPTPKLLIKILNDQKKDIQGSVSDMGVQLSARALMKRKQKAKKVLVIFDDAIASSMITSKEFLKIFIAGRHYGISSMVMTQSYVKVPRSVRLQATHVAMFPSRSTEIERLYTEHGPKELNKNEFTELVQYATRPDETDKYPFLYVDCFAPVSSRFRRGLTDTLAIEDDGVEAKVEEGDGEYEQDPQPSGKRKRRR